MRIFRYTALICALNAALCAVLLCGGARAQTTVSNLPTGVPVSAADNMYAEQGACPGSPPACNGVKVTGAMVKTWAQSGLVSSRLMKLGTKIGADFNVTTDQSITLTGSSFYVVSGVVITNCSASLTTAKGAFYTAAAKTSPLWAQTATTAYTGLDGTAGRSQSIGFTGGASGAANAGSSLAFTGPATIFLSLTTPQGAAATCDIRVFGYDLS